MFDKPVSNSGKLKQIIEEIALKNCLDWKVELVNNPDKVMAESNQIAITSDAWILDHALSNFNLMKYVLTHLNITETIIHSE